MEFPLQLEDIFDKDDNASELARELFIDAIFDPSERIREICFNGLYDYFGFLLKRCYEENDKIYIDLGDSGAEQSFYIMDMPTTHLGDVAIPHFFDYGRNIYELERVCNNIDYTKIKKDKLY